MNQDDLRRHELRSLLKRWGDWQERHYFDASLPHQSSHTLIYADQPAGHKILCAEMGRAVWLINYHIERLSSASQEALIVGYAVNLKPAGGYWTMAEKAERLRLSVNALQVRISRAVGDLHGRIFGLTTRKNSVTSSAMCEIVT